MMSLLLLGVLLTADARPTAGDVASAVQLSREQFTRKHSPPDPNQFKEAEGRRKMASAVQSLVRTQSIKDKDARLAAVKKATEEIERWRRQVADAVSKQQERAPGTELDAFDISSLTIGGVGQLRCRHELNGFTARCERILGPDKSIVRITKYGPAAKRIRGAMPGAVVTQDRSVPRAWATVVLKGYSTKAMQEGQEIQDLTVDLVTVDREVFGRTLLVLEVFNPDKPFQ